MSVVIRPMLAADLPSVGELDRLSFSQPWPLKAFEAELTNPNARCWVAESDGRVAGDVVLWRVLDQAEIATIAVHPDFRRRGVGRELLKTAMDAAYAEGARLYHLEVRAGNRAAQKLYEEFGFEVVGRRPKYYKDNAEDALLMKLVS